MKSKQRSHLVNTLIDMGTVSENIVYKSIFESQTKNTSDAFICIRQLNGDDGL